MAVSTPDERADECAFLNSVEGEISFFRSIMRARPVGMHRYFHVLTIRNAILKDTGRSIHVETIWEKLRECYDLDALDANVSLFEIFYIFFLSVSSRNDKTPFLSPPFIVSYITRNSKPMDTFHTINLISLLYRTGLRPLRKTWTTIHSSEKSLRYRMKNSNPSSPSGVYVQQLQRHHHLLPRQLLS